MQLPHADRGDQRTSHTQWLMYSLLKQRLMGEQNVREECRERYIVTIDFNREALMEYYNKLSRNKNKDNADKASDIWR